MRLQRTMKSKITVFEGDEKKPTVMGQQQPQPQQPAPMQMGFGREPPQPQPQQPIQTFDGVNRYFFCVVVERERERGGN